MPCDVWKNFKARLMTVVLSESLPARSEGVSAELKRWLFGSRAVLSRLGNSISYKVGETIPCTSIYLLQGCTYLISVVPSD